MCTWSRDKTTILQTRSNSHSYNFIDTHAIVHVNKLNIVHCFAYEHTHTWHTHTHTAPLCTTINSIDICTNFHSLIDMFNACDSNDNRLLLRYGLNKYILGY